MGNGSGKINLYSILPQMWFSSHNTTQLNQIYCCGRCRSVITGKYVNCLFTGYIMIKCKIQCTHTTAEGRQPERQTEPQTELVKFIILSTLHTAAPTRMLGRGKFCTLGHTRSMCKTMPNFCPATPCQIIEQSSL